MWITFGCLNETVPGMAQIGMGHHNCHHHHNLRPTIEIVGNICSVRA